MADVAEIRRAEQMYRKIHQKLVKLKTPDGVEKQLDYILVNRKNLKHSRDAEANDMIHMGSDHRSVMARFVIPASKKKDSQEECIAWSEQHGSSRRI